MCIRDSCGDNDKLADEVADLRTEYEIEEKGITKLVEGCSKEDFIKLREDLRDPSFKFSYEKAAKFYEINRSSF